MSRVQHLIEIACYKDGWPAACTIAKRIVADQLPSLPAGNHLYERTIAVALLASADANGLFSASGALTRMGSYSAHDQITVVLQEALRVGALSHWKSILLCTNPPGLIQLTEQCEQLLSDALSGSHTAQYVRKPMAEGSLISSETGRDGVCSAGEFAAARRVRSSGHDEDMSSPFDDEDGLEDVFKDDYEDGLAFEDADDGAKCDFFSGGGLSLPDGYPFDAPAGPDPFAKPDGAGRSNKYQRKLAPVAALDKQRGKFYANHSGDSAFPDGDFYSRQLGTAERKRADLAVASTVVADTLGGLIPAAHQHPMAVQLVQRLVELGKLHVPVPQLDELALLLWVTARRSWPIQTLRDIALTFDDTFTQIMLEQLIDEQLIGSDQDKTHNLADEALAQRLHAVRLEALNGPRWQTSSADLVDAFDRLVHEHSGELADWMALAMTERLLVERHVKSLGQLLAPCVDWRSACMISQGLQLRAGFSERERERVRYALPVLLHVFWNGSISQMLNAAHAESEPELRPMIASHISGSLSTSAWSEFCDQAGYYRGGAEQPGANLHTLVVRIEQTLSGGTVAVPKADVEAAERRAAAARKRTQELTMRRREMEAENERMADEVTRAEAAKAKAEQDAIDRIERDRAMLAVKLQRLRETPAAAVSFPGVTNYLPAADPIKRPSLWHVHHFHEVGLSERQLPSGDDVQVVAQRCRCGLDREVVRKGGLVGRRTIAIRELPTGSHDHFVESRAKKDAAAIAKEAAAADAAIGEYISGLPDALADLMQQADRDRNTLRAKLTGKSK